MARTIRRQPWTGCVTWLRMPKYLTAPGTPPELAAGFERIREELEVPQQFDQSIGDLVGPVTTSIDATALMVQFFRSHPLG